MGGVKLEILTFDFWPNYKYPLLLVLTEIIEKHTPQTRCPHLSLLNQSTLFKSLKNTGKN